jgi:hypothetical protein
MCYCASTTRTPQVSLEPVAHGSDAETEEATWAGVQDTVKLVAVQFEHQAEDT